MDASNASQDSGSMTCLEHRMTFYSAPESGIFLEDLEVFRKEIGISRCEEMPCWQDCPFNHNA
jgi:hypothetical protein